MASETETRLWQTDRQTDRLTDIATYRAAIAAKKPTMVNYYLQQE